MNAVTSNYAEKTEATSPFASPSIAFPKAMTLSVLASCLACGRSYHGSSRFCSTNCVTAWDNEVPAYKPLEMPYDLPKGPNGFIISCSNCGRRFDSKGLRCCSQQCEKEFQKQDGERKRRNNVVSPFSRAHRCVRCNEPLRVQLRGRKRKTCSTRCRTALRRTGDFASKLDFGGQGSPMSQNDSSCGHLPMVSGNENGCRPPAQQLLVRDLWQWIIELETGLPAPPPGMITVLDQRTGKLSFIQQPTPLAGDSVGLEPANDNVLSAPLNKVA